MEESDYIVYYQGNYYNDVFGKQNDFPVPTSQTKSKEKIIEFKNRVNDLLDQNKKENWPHKDKLTITLEIKGSKKYINRIDIDNVLKLLLDIFKKKVFVDDKQIFSIMASKIILDDYEGVELHGFMVGLRILKEGETNNCIPNLLFLEPEFGIQKGQTSMWKAFKV